MQYLKLCDLPLRVEFCGWFLIKTQEDENCINKVIWSDEAKFSKNYLIEELTIIRVIMIEQLFINLCLLLSIFTTGLNPSVSLASALS